MLRVHHLLKRIRDSLKQRGARATARKIAREIADRVSPPRQCLFWMPLASHALSQTDNHVTIQTITDLTDDVLHSMLEGRLGRSTISVFRERLARGCLLCILRKGEEIAGALFFVFGRALPFQHVVITEGDAVILDAWIDPRFRGQGLYARFLDLALESLKAHAVERVFVATSEHNEPSLRALKRVGFRYLLRYRTRGGLYTYDVSPL